MTHGAFTATEVRPEIAQTVWLGGDKKGCYTMLDSHARQILKSAGVDVDNAPIVEDWGGKDPGGSWVLPEAVAKEGLSVCTPIDLPRSR